MLTHGAVSQLTKVPAVCLGRHWPIVQFVTFSEPQELIPLSVLA